MTTPKGLNDGGGHKKSAVEIRRAQISRQIEHLRAGLAGTNQSRYAGGRTHRHRSKRSRELISELEGELLMLDCPGEYDELPAAVVADEMGLTYEHVRSLIKLGEIEATGRPAHERICRGELERIAAEGVPTLLRLSREEPAEIFEQAVPHLQSGDLEKARKAYRRLEARQAWRGPHAPAFLVGLELAGGELEGRDVEHEAHLRARRSAMEGGGHDLPRSDPPRDDAKRRVDARAPR